MTTPDPTALLKLAAEARARVKERYRGVMSDDVTALCEGIEALAAELATQRKFTADFALERDVAWQRAEAAEAERDKLRAEAASAAARQRERDFAREAMHKAEADRDVLLEALETFAAVHQNGAWCVENCSCRGDIARDAIAKVKGKREGGTTPTPPPETDGCKHEWEPAELHMEVAPGGWFCTKCEGICNL